MRHVALLSFVLVSVTPLRAAVLPVGVAAQASAAYRGEWTADTRNTWSDIDGEPRIQFNLRTSAGDSRWGFGVRVRERHTRARARARAGGLPQSLAGFGGLGVDELVKFRIHKVDALFIRHARENGYTVQTPADAVDLAIHGPRRRRGV